MLLQWVAATAKDPYLVHWHAQIMALLIEQSKGDDVKIKRVVEITDGQCVSFSQFIRASLRSL